MADVYGNTQRLRERGRCGGAKPICRRGPEWLPTSDHLYIATRKERHEHELQGRHQGVSQVCQCLKLRASPDRAPQADGTPGWLAG